jgi:4'-phosphopantetheinyl transferase
LQGLPPGARDHAFLVGWTRKEAFLKALGLGISVDLRTVDAGLENAVCNLAYSVDGRSRTWCVAPIDLPAGAIGAIVLDADGADLAVNAFGAPPLVECLP